jgi:carboxyl-terminal processing protease
LIDDARRAELVASFDQVWTTIRDQHWDANLNGADWNAARDELRPKVEQARTDDEARAAINELIARLDQSHFGIIPAEAYARLDELPSGQQRSGEDGASHGESGIRVRVVDGVALVTRVDPGSAGEAAGVRPGYEVLGVRKFDAQDILDRVRAAQPRENLRAVFEAMAFENALEGDVGEVVPATFRDEKGGTVRKQITLRAPTGKPAKFGNLPTMYVTTDVREVAPNVGYVAVSVFMDPAGVMATFRQAVERFRSADGFILDLRGNPGGIGVMANGMSGYLVNQPGLKLGEMITRQSTFKFVINPQPVVFDGPVAVLIDEASMSTSEILAGGLQDIGRARIFGTPSPGAALPSRIEKLPSRDGFQYAFANYVSAKGQVLEGVGVKPDEIIRPDRATLLDGRDPVIDAAVAWIRTSREASASAGK